MGTITVTCLGKAYKQYPTRWSRLAEWMLPGRTPRHHLHWVLQDINFTLNPGEAVGIIGVNGAGKSTLLKMIAGTTQPTTGSVRMTGRVAALLELGMGFHPDFTGRQNAHMAGQLLGYSAQEITRHMPAIEAFAGIGDYIDQPVRVYSSGMQMRLAFSVATAQRPDVLIVDEALSVGDAYFQHKSFDRIRTFRKQGTTLLIVSHDKAAIQSICDRAILLHAGKLAMQGEPEAVMDYYNALLTDHQNLSVKQELTAERKLQTVSGTEEATIIDAALIDSAGRRIEVVSVGQPVSLHVRISCHAAIPDLVVGFMIKDRLGQPVFGTNTRHLNTTLQHFEKGRTIEVIFDFPANLGPGTYSMALALHADDDHTRQSYQWKDLVLMFNVINVNKAPFVGVAWLPVVARHTA
ncbi:ABC transporter ATP-binding protein [Immundisolibacter sp.]